MALLNRLSQWPFFTGDASISNCLGITHTFFRRGPGASRFCGYPGPPWPLDPSFQDLQRRQGRVPPVSPEGFHPSPSPRIDRHGIGMNLAENLRTEFKSRVEGVALVGQVKESLAVGLKIAFENEGIAIPRDRTLTGQVHSIKKTSTGAGYARFDTETNERHHADKCWALALAVHASGALKRPRRRRDGISASIV